MASLDLGKLRISVEVDNAEAHTKLDETKEKVEQTGSSLGEKLGNAAGVAKTALVGVGGALVAAGSAALAAANSTAETAKEINTLSQQAGMSTTAFQEWKYVLEQNGVEADKVKDVTKTLAEQMIETSEEGQAAMSQLGLSFEGMNKEEAFNAVITALQGVEDENEKVRLAATLLGEDYVELMPILNLTAEETNGLKQEAQDLGIVMSEDAVNAGVELGQNMEKLKASFGTVVNELTSALMPILNLVIEKFMEYLPTIKKLIDTAIVPLATAALELAGVLADALGAALEYLMPVVDNVVGVFKGLIEFITGVFTSDWSRAWSGIVQVFGNIFSGIKNLLKEPINWVIGKINNFLGSLNNIKIPDWVPGVGGKGFNIPSIPLLASGGNVVDSGAAIVGEAGAELIELPKGARVTPLDSKHSIGGNITQNNYFTQRELSPYETQLQVKRLSRSLAGAF